MVKFGAPKGNGGGHDPAAAAFHVAKSFAEIMVPRMELDPTIVFLASEGKLAMASLTGDKAGYYQAIQESLREFNAQWYVFLMEAWTTQRKIGDPRPTGKISDLPLDDRKEEVIVYLIQKGKGLALAERAEVLRYKDQRRLGPWQMDTSEMMFSRLTPIDW